MTTPFEVLIAKLDAIGVDYEVEEPRAIATDEILRLDGTPPDRRLLIYPGDGLVVRPAQVDVPGVWVRLILAVAFQPSDKDEKRAAALLAQHDMPEGRGMAPRPGLIIATDLREDPTEGEVRAALHGVVNAARGWTDDLVEALGAATAVPATSLWPMTPPDQRGRHDGLEALTLPEVALPDAQRAVDSVPALLPGWSSTPEPDGSIVLRSPDGVTSATADARWGLEVSHIVVRGLSAVSVRALAALYDALPEVAHARIAVDEARDEITVRVALPPDALVASRVGAVLGDVERAARTVAGILDDVTHGSKPTSDDDIRSHEFDAAIPQAHVPEDFGFADWHDLLVTLREPLAAAARAFIAEVRDAPSPAGSTFDRDYTADEVACARRARQLLADIDEAIEDVSERRRGDAWVRVD